MKQKLDAEIQHCIRCALMRVAFVTVDFGWLCRCLLFCQVALAQKEADPRLGFHSATAGSPACGASGDVDGANQFF